MKRRNFLKALPAAALTLAGCGQHKTAPANTASLVFDHSYPPVSYTHLTLPTIYSV